MEVIVRRETGDDQQAVFALNTAAFGREKEAHLVDALRASDAFVPDLSLVAERDGQIVGYILFTKLRIDGSDAKLLGMGPVAVSPETQRQGVGSTLVEEGLRHASTSGFDAVIVLGHKDYYPKFGFRPASDWNITTAYNAPEDTFAYELKDGALHDLSGEVRYAKEFAEHDC